MSKFYKNMSYERALEKAMRYCSYQEHCQLDLTNRFIAWNVKKTDWNKILNHLIKEDYLKTGDFKQLEKDISELPPEMVELFKAMSQNEEN